MHSWNTGGIAWNIYIILSVSPLQQAKEIQIIEKRASTKRLFESCILKIFHMGIQEHSIAAAKVDRFTTQAYRN